MMRLLLIALILAGSQQGLKAQQHAGEALAEKLAQRMQDSLLLTDHQRSRLFVINMGLANQKSTVRSRNTAPDSLRVKFQLIENSRDSLYRSILGEEKYMLYKQKKRSLITNN